MKFRDRIKEFKRVSAADLRPNPKNWRTHPQAQQDALRKVLAEVGFADTAIARELPDGSLQLIDGHLRTEVAGDAPIPVLVLDVTEAEADKLLATLDPLTAMADKNAEALASLFADLQTAGDTLASSVWPDYIIDPLVSADWSPPEVEEMPERGPVAAKVPPVFLDEMQRTIFEEAAARCRQERGFEDYTDGQCLVRICETFLQSSGD